MHDSKADVWTPDPGASLAQGAQGAQHRGRDPKLGSPLQEFIAAVIVPALVNRWHREQENSHSHGNHYGK